MKKKKSYAISERTYMNDSQGRTPGEAASLGALTLLLLLVMVFAPAFAASGEERLPQPANSRHPVSVPQGGEGKIVVAKVNGVDITMAEVTAMMTRLGARKGPGNQPDSNDAVRKQALDRLIFQELAYQKAKAEGLTADPKDVETAFSNLKKKLGTEEEYQKFLLSSDLTEKELQTQLLRAIMVDRIFTREVFNHTQIAEDEVKKEYEKGKNDYVKPEKIVIIDVVFFLETQDKASLKKAEEILEKIKADESRDPLKLIPDGTFAVRELEFNKDEEKELYEEAKKLQPGGLSGVVITHDSLHVFKLKEYLPFKQLSFEEVKGPLKASLRKQAQKIRMTEWEAELKKNAKIVIMEINRNGKKEDEGKK